MEPGGTIREGEREMDLGIRSAREREMDLGIRSVRGEGNGSGPGIRSVRG